jgi:drug/metabolite transporter (DMT)-like permease
VRGLAGRTDLLLLATVVIWALNLPVTRYLLTNGFLPLVYASLRYGLAGALTAGFTLAREGSLVMHGRRLRLVLAVAMALLFVNQLCFVYSLKLTTATTVALILGVTPMFTAIVASLVGLERLDGRFWLAAATSFAGVALVAVGSGGDLSTDLGGDLLAVGLAATWGAYSVAIAPLMRRYSPYRVSSVVLLPVVALLVLVSIPQLSEQDFSDLGALVWLGFAYATLGPLALTNVLWFTAIKRVGPSRATLFANLQPFLAAVFAVLLLSETLTGVQIVGGVAIALGIVLARGRRRGKESLPAPTE